MLNSIFTCKIKEQTRRAAGLKVVDFCTEEGKASGKQNFDEKATRETEI